MKKYDEYQKLMRYKYGYYSFNLLVGLLVLNTLLGIIFDAQWGETKEVEMLFILFLVMLFFVILSVYHNAYFRKNDNVKGYIWLFLVTGIINLHSSFQVRALDFSNTLVEGKVSSDFIYTFGGLIWLAIPITYFVRNAVDKRRERKNEF
ncbi:hypothetical protein JTF06_02840 [Desemzia sp. RIT804]|uniref:hypothetical protein n=1 Tax=Desemzia sp. RIT 804 TaxID=2810209 RepID=UPI001951EA10|nr:hypothetical protein [Desemzia sp. RIT 804]MBM6613830.1 hypothetical protein [Desemzia sp. RIT 804]